MTVEEARELAEQVKKHHRLVQDGMKVVIVMGLSNGMKPTALAQALLVGKRSTERTLDPDGNYNFDLARLMFDPVLEFVLDPDSEARFAPDSVGPEFLPMTEEEQEDLLDGLRRGLQW